jgi:cell division protein FtsA
MAFLNLFNKKNNTSNYAISLDIGTESVKTLMFEVRDGKGYVKGVGKQRQRLSDMQGGTVTDIQGVIQNCEKALERAAEQAGILPEQVVIGIAGELVKGATTTVRYTRDHPKTKIEMTELKEIINRVQKRAFDRARQILACETGQEAVDVRLVNAAIVDVTIDGYKVTNPLGFQGKEIQIGIYNCFAPFVHLGALQTIAEDLGLDLISVTAEPYAVARCMGSEESTESSAIFVDIGGGTSDIAVVRNGGVEGTKMFALGGRAFTKRISAVTGENFPTAEDLKLKYSKKETSKEDTEIIKRALESDCQVWLSGVELTLGEFSNVDLLPSRILLCGGGSNLPEISEILKTDDWRQSLPFAKKPAVHHLMPKDVTNIIDETGELTNPADVTPMALANIALDLVGEETLMEGILNRVVSSLRS